MAKLEMQHKLDPVLAAIKKAAELLDTTSVSGAALFEAKVRKLRAEYLQRLAYGGKFAPTGGAKK